MYLLLLQLIYCSRTKVTNFLDNFDNDDVDGAIAKEQVNTCTFHDNMIEDDEDDLDLDDVKNSLMIKR